MSKLVCNFEGRWGLVDNVTVTEACREVAEEASALAAIFTSRYWQPPAAFHPRGVIATHVVA
jgi:hypothetical protein